MRNPMHGEPMCGIDHSVKLLKSEIEYDVRFDSTIRDRVLNRETHNANNKAKKVGYQIPEDDIEDWLVRQIESALDNVCGELAWCTEEYDRFTTDELYDLPDEWALHLHFSRMWAGSVRALRTYIHKYVCEFILYQWYRGAIPTDAEKYNKSAEDWLNKAYNEARSERVQLEPFNL